MKYTESQTIKSNDRTFEITRNKIGLYNVVEIDWVTPGATTLLSGVSYIDALTFIASLEG